MYLAFDFGTRNIGVASGQKLTGTATPLQKINAKRGVPNWKEVEDLIKKWQPTALIVGVPINLDGTEHEITNYAKNFIRQLEERFHLPVYAAEERLTTKAARSRIFEAGGYKALQAESIDSFAAKLILEEWMRSN